MSSTLLVTVPNYVVKSAFLHSARVVFKCWIIGHIFTCDSVTVFFVIQSQQCMYSCIETMYLVTKSNIILK